MLALGKYELDTHISRGVGNFVYNPLIGCSMAGDIFLSLMYSSIDRNNGFSSNTSKRKYRVMVLSAYVAISADISLGFVSVYCKTTLRNKIILPLSILMVLGQLLRVFSKYTKRKLWSRDSAYPIVEVKIKIEALFFSKESFGVVLSTLSFHLL